MNGATVTIVQESGGTSNFSNNGVMGGQGYYNGSAYGNDLFLGANVTFNVRGSGTMSLNSLGGAGNLADVNVTSNDNQNDPDAQGGIIKQGTGTLTLTGDSYYTGQTLVEQGTLTLTPGATRTGSKSIIVGTTERRIYLQNGSAIGQPAPGVSIVLGQNSGVNGTLTIANAENPENGAGGLCGSLPAREPA